VRNLLDSILWFCFVV